MLAMDSPTKKVVDSNFKLSVFGRLNALRQENILCDVSLLVDNESDVYPVHKNVLAAASPYFFSLFTTNMQEKTSSTIKLKSVNSKVVKKVIDYIYTGEIDIQFSNAKQLAMAADYLLISRLKTLAITFLEENLNPENCFDLRKFGIQISCPSLERAADLYIIEHFHAVSQTTGFKQLDFAAVAEWTGRDDIEVSKEEEVLDSVLDWIKYDLSNRRVYLEELLKNVRLFSMSKFSLKEYLNKELLIHESLVCTHILMSGLHMHLFPDSGLQFYQKPRHCLKGEVKVVMVIGGHALTGKIPSGCMLAYELSHGGWYTLNTEMSNARSRHCATVCGGFLYVLGGTPAYSLERFDHRVGAWNGFLLSQIEGGIKHAAVVAFEEKICVFGGENQAGHFLDLVQEYNPTVNEWRVLSYMSCARASHCAVVVDRFVYVVGGRGENEIYSSGERYNLITDEWTSITNMNQQRRFAASANIKGKVFIAGGYGKEWNAYCSCELYDPETDQWDTFTCMPSPRAACGAVQFEDNVYLLGGESDADSAVDSVICYNAKECSWKNVTTLPVGRSCLQTCIINLPRSILKPL